jgi:AcrR family transcriptional regulator
LTADERRDQLLEVAARLFAKRGFARTTTREIARAAGVSEGAIYRHFRSKEELLFTYVRRAVVGSANSLLSGLEEASADEWVRAIFRNRFELAERNSPLLKVVIGEAFFNERFAAEYSRTVFEPMVRLLEAQIALRVESGDFRPVDAALAARSMMGLFFSALFWNVLYDPLGERPAQTDIIEGIAGVFLDGVRCRVAEPRRTT